MRDDLFPAFSDQQSSLRPKFAIFRKIEGIYQITKAFDLWTVYSQVKSILSLIPQGLALQCQLAAVAWGWNSQALFFFWFPGLVSIYTRNSAIEEDGQIEQYLQN